MKLTTYILSLSLLLLSAFVVYSYTNVYESFDTSLVQGIEYVYQEPRKILFTQIEGNYDNLALSLEEYINTVYYYSITKLKLGNVPYHYIVDESGNVHKVQSADGIKLTDEAYIVVGYLSNNGQISNKASRSILDLTNELSYREGIEEYDVYKYTIAESEGTLSTLLLGEANELFLNSIDEALIDWEPSEREHKEYIASVQGIEHDESVDIGERLSVKVIVRNDNDFIWTSNRDPIYLSVKDGQESVFAVNEVWDSFSKVTSIDSDKYVLPGDTIEIEFSLEPKVVPGEYAETFELLKFEEEPFIGSEFAVEFSVVKGEGRVVEITSPEYGFVNIRECRRFSCDKIHVVYEGEVYPVLEYHESCWYKISYGPNQEGWLYCPYAKEI
jgi:hypothetical protein